MTLACSSYNRNGTHVCHRNSIDEKPLLDFIVGSIREKALAPENLDRLRAELARQVKQRRQDKPVKDDRIRKQLARGERELKAAITELRRAELW